MTPVKGNIGRFRSGLTALLAVAGGVILCALAGVMTDHLWLAALPTLVLPFAAAYAVTGSAGRVLVAFAGNIVLEELGSIRQLGLDILDIGYAILDAPCLPMRFDVVDVAG